MSADVPLRDHPDMLIQQWEDSAGRVRRAKWRKKHQQEWLEYCADHAQIDSRYYNTKD